LYTKTNIYSKSVDTDSYKFVYLNQMKQLENWNLFYLFSEFSRHKNDL